MMSRSVKSIIALVVCAVLAACAFTAFGFSQSFGANADRSANGKVIFFNLKPEATAMWEEVAKEYTKQTGVTVSIVTPTGGQYEKRLKTEVEKYKDNPDSMPTLFQINGPVGYANWKDYTADLTNSPLYTQLSNKNLAFMDNGKPVAVPYVTENYGLIYNKALLARYADLKDAKLQPEENGKSFEDQITNFAALKAVADDLQKRKDELGIDGAFASAGFDLSSDWRFKTHLANMPLYYQFVKNNVNGQPQSINYDYVDNFRKIFDLYISDSTTPVSQLSAKTGEDAVYEFALGKAVFYQNGTWAWGDLSKAGIKPDDVGMLPIYIGAKGEEKQGMATGSENYWCINKKASRRNQEATNAFLNWLLTTNYGKDALANKMGFAAPFKGFPKAENPLVQAAVDYTAKPGKLPVKWVFVTMPSNGWKDDVGSDLLTYAQATKDGMTSIGANKAWATLKSAFVDGWAKEYKIAHGQS
ncbi:MULTISPECIES: ABC transporter substrate-binding protein [Gardnerella]|jgi:ABC-type sugar transporter, periplasmic component|uniref:ABC transporter substrate-binding protein n=1 Tax=Gardnerella TaxID=2701 RepID=UPI000C9C9B11|nr:ABC transporter substrate-binding protein [Gardnerella sp. DNF01162]PMC43662.1 ABC transporter substrate-binding protein [Gardnerella vaginalis]PNP89290.1 ABC transporter substrate-binding protein [Gardnerella sp. DNF01162]